MMKIIAYIILPKLSSPTTYKTGELTDMDLKQAIIDLYQKAATQLPLDVVLAISQAQELEDNPVAQDILRKISDNIELAKSKKSAICQDTGSPIFYVKRSSKYDTKDLTSTIELSTTKATQSVPLRPNAVEALTGKDLGNKPIIYFEDGEGLQIDLLLKGGGSENVSTIYQLPDVQLQAGRDLSGVKKCILDAIFKAQGKGCPPYIIGVAIGGSIEEVAHLAKKQLLRSLDDNNDIPELGAVEKDVLETINELGIGPMGLGGKTTALAVKLISGNRHPATFFVGISFSCWCLRRQKLNYD